MGELLLQVKLHQNTNRCTGNLSFGKCDFSIGNDYSNHMTEMKENNGKINDVVLRQAMDG